MFVAGQLVCAGWYSGRRSHCLRSWRARQTWRTVQLGGKVTRRLDKTFCTWSDRGAANLSRASIELES